MTALDGGPETGPIARPAEAPPAASAASAPLVAYGYMIGAMLGFSAMAVAIRVASAELHTLQIVFFRNFFALLMFSPLVLRNGVRMLKSPQLTLHLWRGVNGLAAMTCFFTALSLAPLAEVTALGFAMPLFATFGAVAFLGEQIRWRRMMALGLGFLGVMLVLGPSIGAPSLGSALALLGAALIGVAVVMVKKLTQTDSAAQISIWMVLVQTPLALVPALFVWTTPSLYALSLLVAIAAFGSLAHLSWTKASALGEVSQLQPVEFVRLPLIAAIAYVLFDETPTVWTWIGGGVIFVSTTYIAWREAQLARRNRA